MSLSSMGFVPPVAVTVSWIHTCDSTSVEKAKSFYCILCNFNHNSTSSLRWCMNVERTIFHFEIWKKTIYLKFPLTPEDFSALARTISKNCVAMRAASDPRGDATLPKSCSKLSVLRVAEGWKLRLSQILRLSPGDGLAISSWFWPFKTVSHPHWSLRALSSPCGLCQVNDNDYQVFEMCIKQSFEL